MNRFETSVKAKRAAKAEEAEKKAPPWSYKGWEDPNLLSERELMMRGIKGHCQKTVEAIIGENHWKRHSHKRPGGQLRNASLHHFQEQTRVHGGMGQIVLHQEPVTRCNNKKADMRQGKVQRKSVIPAKENGTISRIGGPPQQK